MAALMDIRETTGMKKDRSSRTDIAREWREFLIRTDRLVKSTRSGPRADARPGGGLGAGERRRYR
jgi:hypothetical protein